MTALDTVGWPQLNEEPYIAECPAGGHDAAWVGRCFQKPNSIQSRSTVTVDCRVCQP